jgi:hypothetical protein
LQLDDSDNNHGTLHLIDSPACSPPTVWGHRA